MKLRLTDWKIEGKNLEEFNGYTYRYELNEVLSEDNNKATARTIIASNNMKDIRQEIGKLALSEAKISFVENESYLSIKTIK